MELVSDATCLSFSVDFCNSQLVVSKSFISLIYLFVNFGQDLDGRLLTVNKAAPRGERVERPPRAFEPSFRIYVGNLPWDVDTGRLEQVFSEHGKVVESRVVYDRETGRSRGFGFVTMSSETEMNDAIAALDGQVLQLSSSFRILSRYITCPDDIKKAQRHKLLIVFFLF